VSPRARTRVQRCGAAEARSKLAHAKKFLETAELVKDEPGPEFSSVAASLAVLAGIAASDAAACKALGQRSRSENHHDAERLLEQIAPGGRAAANALRRLINLKDDAQYGFISLGGADLIRAMRKAEALVAFADEVLRR
jgi:hypothetical protein